MLHLLDESLESFVQAEALPARQVDVAFDAPDADWAAGLSMSRPTVNLFLWDVRPNLGEREFGEEVVELADGVHARREPLPRVDCRFFVSVWTSEISDEHELLGGLLRAFLLHPVIGEEHMNGSLTALRPLPKLKLRGGDATANSDFWSAVGGQLKPGLDLVVTTVVDASLALPLAPQVQEGGLVVGATEKPREAPRKRKTWPDPAFPR